MGDEISCLDRADIECFLDVDTFVLECIFQAQHVEPSNIGIGKEDLHQVQRRATEVTRKTYAD